MAHTTLRSAALALALLGCTARGGNTNPSVDLDAGAIDMDSASGEGTCAQLCGNLTGSGCDPAACMTSCGAIPTLSACATSRSTLFACIRGATPMCTEPDAFPYPGCTSQLAAFAQCVTQQPATDSGVAADRGSSGDPCAVATNCASCTAMGACGWCAGSCHTGTSSGPSTGTCGGSAWAWTSGMCSSAPADSGMGSGPISTECQSCAITNCMEALTPCVSDTGCTVCLVSNPPPSCASNAAFLGVQACACGACPSQCSALCQR